MKLTNYHTHTNRCHHASGSDEDYVIRAIQQGFSVLGFSDHCPWPFSNSFVSPVRMEIDCLEGYVTSIEKLKCKYQNKIDIKIGLECESFPWFFDWLDKKKQQYSLDYLLLGNHYMGKEEDGVYYGHITNSKDFTQYYQSLEAALKSDLFVYIAHPDLVFSDYQIFDSCCEDLSLAICELSLKYHTPLEYNTSGFRKRLIKETKGLGFPCEQFWKYVANKGCEVIIGMDAHSPSSIEKNLYWSEKKKLTNNINLIDEIHFDSK